MIQLFSAEDRNGQKPGTSNEGQTVMRRVDERVSKSRKWSAKKVAFRGELGAPCRDLIVQLGTAGLKSRLGQRTHTDRLFDITSSELRARTLVGSSISPCSLSWDTIGRS